MRNPDHLPVVALTCLLAACSASCLPRNLTPSNPPAPRAFTGVPTLQDVVRVVNTNTERVQRLQMAGATLAIDNYPDLRANLAVERPRRLRLQAGTPWTGPELDLGSNDQLFWVWVKHQQPPGVYYARHQQWESGALRGVLPVAPSWIIEAIGLVHFDPQARHEGPYPRGPGRLEVRSPGSFGSGESTRVTVVDSVYGWVVEQSLIDYRGQQLARAVMSQHQYDPVHAVSLPRRIDITIRPAGLAFTLRATEVVVNATSTGGDPDPLWTMPRIADTDYVDLGDPRVVPPRAAAVAPTPLDTPPPRPREARLPWMQRYQGFSQVR